MIGRRNAFGELDVTMDFTGSPDVRPLILKRGGTKHCDPTQVLGFCRDGHRRAFVYACTSRRCESKTCTRHALRQRQETLRPLMRESFPGAWGVLVLTYAPELRPLLQDAGVFRRARRAAIAVMEQTILEHHGLGRGWRLGLASMDHPEGDRTPGEWKPHHNLLFPAIAFRGEERRDLRYSFPKELLDLLRERWQWVQEFLLGRALGRSADVWYQFRRGDRKKGHALKYFPRTFPAWPARAQRLTWCGAFGAAVLHRLKEVKATEATPREGLCCLVCKTELIRFEYPDGPVPHGHRSLTGVGPPTGGGP